MTDFFETLVACDPEPDELAKLRNIASWGFCSVCRHDKIPGEKCGRPDCSEPAPAPITRAPAHLACNLTVLALDLGTTTGWAIAPRNGALRSGSFRLDPAKVGGNGRRWIAFREWLTATAREVGGVQVVYVEDVRRHVSNLSARVYCGYLAMLEAWCAANNVRLEGVGVGTVKKHFTGNGRASKTDMIVECERRGFNVLLDDEADALAILAYGVQQES